MKLIRTASHFKIAFYTVDQWEYKGHKCIIEEERETDVAKAYHTVIKPNGEKVHADISPYSKDRKTVEAWIDMGYPQRKNGVPFRLPDQYDDIFKHKQTGTSPSLPQPPQSPRPGMM
jgi:hypothetical protein